MISNISNRGTCVRLFHLRNCVVFTSILLSMLSIGLTGSSADGGPDLLNETFEGMQVGTTPVGWGVNATGSSSVTVQEEADGNHFLQLRDSSARSTQGIHKTFPESSGLLTVEANVRLPDGASAGRETVLFYVLDSQNRAAVSLTLSRTRITSFHTVNGTTSTITLASGLPLYSWCKITVAADFATKTFDFYMNDELMNSDVPFRYDDILTLSRLQVTGAYYPEEQNYLRLADLDDIRIYQGEPDIIPPEPVDPPAPGIERNSFDSYSSVFLSSRWYYQDGQNGMPGTLNILKQFMATDDKWTYETNPVNIRNMILGGVSFQGTLNMNIGTGGRAEYFDGTPIIAPWMISFGSTWGSMSDPVYYQQVLNTGKGSINSGVTSFQFDDWRGSAIAYVWGGDFNPASMTRFRDYLEDHYSTVQLAAWDIPDISAFNYKTYLQTKFNIQTNNDYINRRQESPLDDVFQNFMFQESVRFQQNLQADLEAYAGHPLEFSANASIMQTPQVGDHFLHDLFNYEIGETMEDALGISNLVTFGAMATGLGKPQVISPKLQNPEAIRQGITTAYALGQYALVPWDVYIQDSPRYYGTVTEYGDLYHFIRQYPYLFDGYEVPAKVGVLINWNQMSLGSLSQLSMKLFQNGVPFKDVVANESLPHYVISGSQLTGLDQLIAYSNIDSFTAEDQAAIAASGIPVITPQDISSTWLKEYSAVSVAGDSDLYATLRTKDDALAPKVIHIINRNGLTTENVTVTLSDADFFDGVGIQAVLYRPGHNPQALTAHAGENGQHSITIPELDEWGVIRVSKVAVPDTIPFQVPLPWSGLNMGSPAKEGSAAEPDVGRIEVTSEGMGIGIPVTGDDGSYDQLSYVYQHLEATGLQDLSISAKLGQDANSSDGALAGLMIREAPSSNAKFVAIAYEKGNGLKAYWRDKDNGKVSSVPLGSIVPPVYLKIERHDGVYAFYTSTDGTSWDDALVSHISDMNHPLGGVFTAAGVGGDAQQSTFDDLAITYGNISLPPGQLQALQISGLPEKLLIGKAAELRVDAIIDHDGTLSSVDVTKENLNFTSSDPNVALINHNGVLFGKGAGDTTITVSFTANGTTVTADGILKVVDSTTLVDETFDAYSETEVPSGWRFSPSEGSISYMKVTPSPSETDRSLIAYDNTPTGFPWAFIDFEPQAGQVTIDMDYKVDFGSDPSGGQAMVAYLLGQEKTQYAVSLLVSHTGFWYLDGTNTVGIAPVVEGQWYHIRIMAYPDTQKMDLYMDGVEVVHQGNFRNVVGDIRELMVGGTGTGVDTLSQWNNVLVTSGVPDVSAPMTSATITPGQPDGQNGYYISPVTIALSATDDKSGVTDSVYRLDPNQAWQKYTSPVTLQNDGEYSLQYRSTDRAGNVEPVKTLDIRIDREAPVTTSQVQGTLDDNGWYVSQVEVSLQASDHISSVTESVYSLDNGVSFHDYSGPIALSDGEFTLWFHSIDAAGNQEADHMLTLKVDSRIPGDILASLQRSLDAYETSDHINIVFGAELGYRLNIISLLLHQGANRQATAYMTDLLAHIQDPSVRQQELISTDAANVLTIDANAFIRRLS